MIGGSLALALRVRQPTCSIRLWGRNADSCLQAAQAVGGDTKACVELEAAVDSAEIVILCTPVEIMPDLAKSIAPFLSKEAAVTDAGSVKGDLALQIEQILGTRFVGSHPMAGSEKTGFASAKADLFSNSICIVTPTAGTDPNALDTVCSLWQSVGCKLLFCDPLSHDVLIANISHVPHVTASALVELANSRNRDDQSFAGPGYRDCTRVAMGSADLWAGILLANRPAVSESLSGLIDILSGFRKQLDAGDRNALAMRLQAAADFRRQLTAPPAR